MARGARRAPGAAQPEQQNPEQPQPGLVDPNVRKPDGVKAAASLAEEIWRANYEAPAAEPQGREAPLVDNPDAPAAGDPEPEPNDPSEPEVSSEPEAEEPDEGTTPDPWQNRYNAMRGRFDQASEQNRQLHYQVQALQQRLQGLEQQPAQPQPQQRGQPLVTDAEREEYGQEFLDVVRRQAREDLVPELARLQQEVKSLRGLVGNTQTHIAMDARQRMEADLDATLPAWRDVNMMQDFIDWLQLPDVYSGAIRHDLLRQAFEQNHTPRVLAFFNGFLREVAVSRPADAGSAPAAPQNTGPSQPRMNLGQLAAPGRGRAAGAPQQPAAGKPFISRTDISRFYDDVRAGRYNGRLADKAAAEQEIMEAQREGRIV